jgi:N-ethylmaleimide reductase
VYDHILKQLGTRNIAFVHIVEGATGGARDFKQGDKSVDYDALKASYVNAGGKGLWIANNGYNRDLAIAAIESGKADAIAFGKAFIANPDLVQRLKDNAELNTPNQPTFYGGGAEGYTDYPALAV